MGYICCPKSSCSRCCLPSYGDWKLALRSVHHMDGLINCWNSKMLIRICNLKCKITYRTNVWNIIWNMMLIGNMDPGKLQIVWHFRPSSDEVSMNSWTIRSCFITEVQVMPSFFVVNHANKESEKLDLRMFSRIISRYLW